jgi:hypothetical protein
VDKLWHVALATKLCGLLGIVCSLPFKASHKLTSGLVVLGDEGLIRGFVKAGIAETKFLVFSSTMM